MVYPTTVAMALPKIEQIYWARSNERCEKLWQDPSTVLLLLGP